MKLLEKLPGISVLFAEHVQVQIEEGGQEQAKVHGRAYQGQIDQEKDEYGPLKLLAAG